VKRTRVRIVLVCDECAARNYETTKAQRDRARNERAQQRLTIKKYCPHCGHHTVHTESR